MKILLINKSIGMMRGGGETRALAFARGLRRRGFDVEILTNRPLTSALRHPIEDTMPSRTVRSPYLRTLSYRVPRGSGVVLRIDEHVFKLVASRAIARGPRPDLILSFGLLPLAADLRRRLNVPVVVASSGGIPPGNVARAARSVDAIIAEGDDLVSFPRVLGVTPVEIRKGVDTERFHPSPAPDRDRDTGRITLLWVGRLVPVKNVPLLLRITRELRRRGRQARLVLAGDGELRGTLEKEARRLGLGIPDDVTFLGHVPHDALADVYRSADIFVLSSTFDNFPNAILEAMASGLPVVATAVGGVPAQVVHDVTGLLAPSDDDRAFLALVETLIDDRDRRTSMARAGRDVARSTYDWDVCLDRLAGLCRQLIQL